MRQQLTTASDRAMQSNVAASSQLDDVLKEEREQAAADRQNLLSQITSLVVAQGEAQDSRLTSKIQEVQKDVLASKEGFESSRVRYSAGMDAWNEKETELVEEVLRSRETLKSKLKEDWVVSHTMQSIGSFVLTESQAANKHNTTLQATTNSVHAETVRIVDEQMKDIEIQMRALDDFVTRARSQNAQHHDSHAQSLQSLSGTVKSSYSNIDTHFTSIYKRVRDLGDEMSAKTASLQESLAPLDSVLKEPLTTLRENITNTSFQEYKPTGETPQKIQYTYPTELPRTEAHEALLAAMRRPTEFRSPSKSMISMVPVIFNDGSSSSATHIRQFSHSLGASTSRPQADPEIVRPTTSGSTGLREMDVNVQPGTAAIEEHQSQIPSFKRSISSSGKLPVLKSKKSLIALEGRENVLSASVGPGNPLAQVNSTGRRRSPRNG